MSEANEREEADILTLGMRADEARRRTAHGTRVTYRRVQVVRPAEIGRVALQEAASELRLYETPDSLDEARSQVEALRAMAGGRPVTAFSFAELEQRARGGWGDIGSVVSTLAAAGLSDVAELPVDLVANLRRSMRLLYEAGMMAGRVTVAQPLGDRKSAIIEAVRQGMRESALGVFFAPLPRHVPADKPTTGYEDLRMVAMSRLGLSDLISRRGAPLIEVDWVLYGPKLAQVALMFGADHLDAVPASDDPSLGPRRTSVQDVERNIRAAGFEPHEHRFPRKGRGDEARAEAEPSA